MRNIRRSVQPCFAALAAALALAVPASASASTPPGGVEGVKVPTLHWKDCRHGFQCATAAVPRDYARPAGPTFRLAVIRRPARERAHRIGSLFLNPGGPGGSGVEFLRNVAPALAALNKRFDLVSWDPRGVGASRPAVRCYTDAEVRRMVREQLAAPSVSPGKLDEGAAIAAARSQAAHCLKSTRGVLPYLSTGNVARDLDVLRAAVGDERLSYLGYSYGTAIGMTYVSMFPDRQRAIALDGAVDTTWFDDPLRFDHGQAIAKEAELGRFLEACRAHRRGCGFGGAHPRRALDALLARLDRTPIADRDLPVNGEIARAFIGELLNVPALWPLLARGLRRAQHGDGSVMKAIMATDLGENDASYTAVRANDAAWPTSPSAYRQEAQRASIDFPHFAGVYGFAELSFAYLRPQTNGRFDGPFRTPDDAPTTLVVGTTFDPATPYADAKALVTTLGNARLLTLDGDGHGASYINGNGTCIDDAVTAYLVDQQLPGVGKVCDQAPQTFAGTARG
ncbi:MAG TPA: alpha/beta hydrolase [Solirubrobacteraceae bacterium]